MQKNIFYILTLVLLVSSPSTAHALKVSSSPSSASLPENLGSETFTISLDEPIIAEVGEGYVTLNITTNDSRVSVSTSSLTYTEDNWFTSQTFTASTTGDSFHNASSSAYITVTAVSNSEYYSGFVHRILLTLIDDDAAAPEQRRGLSIPMSSSIVYGCRDTTAKNYDRFTAHRQSLCIYNIPQPILDIKKVNVDLQFGMKNNDVKTLHTFLIQQNKGVYAQALKSIGATDYFSMVCKQALAEWQESVGITPANGTFGPKTRKEIGGI